MKSNMKKFNFLILSLFTTIFLIAQKNGNKSIGIYLPVLANNIAGKIWPAKGVTGYVGNGSHSFGINYIYSTCKCSAYEAGIEFSTHSITIEPAPNLLPNKPYDTRINLLSIPIALRMNLLKYFFVTGGTMLDIDVSKQKDISNQSGFGASFGFGFKYDFNAGIGFYINPYFKSHSWVSFVSGEKNLRLKELGLRLGVVFRIKQKSLKKEINTIMSDSTALNNHKH
jgi:hypothetical protein